MLSFTDFIIWIVIDFFIVNIGVLLSFYIVPSQVVLQNVLDGAVYFIVPVSFFYTITNVGFGLYKKLSNVSLAYLFTRSFKSVLIANLFFLTIAGIFKKNVIHFYPLSIIITSFFINYFLLAGYRVLLKIYYRKEKINGLFEFIIWRIPEILIISISFLISIYIINAKSNNYELFKVVIMPGIILYLFSNIYSKLYVYNKKTWCPAIFFRSLKSSFIGSVMCMAYIFIMRETDIVNIGESVLFCNFILYSVFISGWYIFRTSLPVEIEVDVFN